MNAYITELRRGFGDYRKSHFAGRGELFEPRPEGDAVVFKREFVENNLLTPQCSAIDRAQIIGKIPRTKRHTHFGSMQSSQALAQSIFGTLEILNRLPLLSEITAEGGLPAFASMLSGTKLAFEQEIRTLGEKPPRTTSIDVWFAGTHRIAVECKLAEPDFGTCSRTRLKPTDREFEEQHCDGNYARQRERIERCSLSEIKVQYWKHLEELFTWRQDIDHRPCPLNKTYQLVRNILAACVNHDGKLDVDSGHALVVYDQRNPTMMSGGICDSQWRTTYQALQARGTLRRISWQSFIRQWPKDEILDSMKTELRAKYGLC